MVSRGHQPGGVGGFLHVLWTQRPLSTVSAAAAQADCGLCSERTELTEEAVSHRRAAY